jgi:GTP-binding protein LepA
VVTSPSITYVVKLKNGKEQTIYSPHFFPNDGEVIEVKEPWVKIKIITPQHYLSSLMPLLYEHEAEIGESENFGDNRSAINVIMPLREMMRNFFDELKSVSSGYASISYEFSDMRKADVTRLDILVAEELVPAFTRVVSKRRAIEEAENAVEKLHGILPRQQFVTKIQGYASGRILASRTISAFRKDVTGYLYGGDITRKMKLLEKQKKGKKKMQSRAKANIPHDVFLKMMKGE